MAVVINLSVKTTLMALLLKDNIDEIIACSSTAQLSYRPIKILNLNEKICKACEGNKALKKALPKSIEVPTQLLANVFKR